MLRMVCDGNSLDPFVLRAALRMLSIADLYTTVNLRTDLVRGSWLTM